MFYVNVYCFYTLSMIVYDTYIKTLIENENIIKLKKL